MTREDMQVPLREMTMRWRGKIHGITATTLPLIVMLRVAAGQAPPKADPVPLPGNLPFVRYTTQDAEKRTVTFYISKTIAEQKRLPIVLYCPGSGSHSVFTANASGASSGFQGFLLQVVKGRAHVMVVEKPGVKFLDTPAQLGSSLEGSEEFLRNYAPKSWAEVNIAALRTAWLLPQVDGSRTLVLGASEGGQIAARVAAHFPEVTHVAVLACGGATQLFDALTQASQPRPNDNPGDAGKRRQAVLDEWAKIQADPDSISKFWNGHPYRRWSSFLRENATTDLVRAKARVYLAHGSADEAVPVVSHDQLEAELRAKGRPVTSERLEGLNHSFQPKDSPPGRPSNELAGLLKRILEWFLASDLPMRK